ncbi:MAG TPA: ribosome biogenesis GTPase Der [Acidimicrobiales bacterium]|jgi:GTP-binding protein|nr:ribosome biogenesis GTPase Der [Acidimicrobiales bacterium]
MSKITTAVARTPTDEDDGSVPTEASALYAPDPEVVLPRVVIAGRPNVGKSTLLNRIVGRRAAIVEEKPGVTRDRFEIESDWRGRRFLLVDTGGITERGSKLDRKVSAQAIRAFDDAQLILWVLDAVTGPTAEDEAVSQILRRHTGKVVVVANKVDSLKQEAEAWALTGLGFGDPALISALHGRSVGDLLDVVVDRLGDLAPEIEGEVRGGAPVSLTDRHTDNVLASVALVGRPNVGKSTLFNRLVGDERTVVHDVAGTTRDAIDTIIDTDEGRLRLIDTAGLRRRSRINEGTEYYSLVRSLAAIDHADVALLVIDAADGVTHQEQRLAERVDIAGSPIVLLLNKWDLLNTEQRLEIAAEFEDKLGFLAYAPVLRISAKSGLGVHRLLPALKEAIDAYHRRIPTGQLNEAVKQLQSAHPSPGGRILYAVQGATDPPTFTLFATKRIPTPYLRYLERSLRERFGLGPTPLKFRVRQRGS